MRKSDFLIALEDVLQREEPCQETDNLEDYIEWDSLSKMSVMAYYDLNFGVKMTLAELKNITKVSDLIALAGEHIHD